MFLNPDHLVPKLEQNKRINTTGLPNLGEPEFLSIGILRKPHGIKGEMHMEVWTDFPERIAQGTEIFAGEGKDRFIIQSFRKIEPDYLIHLEGVNDPQKSQIYRNKIVYVISKDRPTLTANQFYHHEIINLEVFTTENEYLGIINEIIQTGSNDVYVVRTNKDEQPEVLLPAISTVIIEVDLKKGRMVVNPPLWA
jgi:16S rRNA processing protein RimM